MVVPRLAAVLARLPGRRTPVDDTWNGGSFLHWVQGRDGLRLAGEFIPDAEPRTTDAQGAAESQRTGRRRGPRRSS
ncbi:hypothetical protein EV383_3645 [Pseudonocardia sediminis]|uniref:Uncharacterized protein n=1 Tax=Pseudonocardia sediminis TaxID=1397368 RepID=A0A4Q7UXF6_PSEST|nr:hypothetical protein [Pseudonocardia sediminis]RZT86747.1 hypothetical protein EV383_3645 [Pseudonocardia sediminis]